MWLSADNKKPLSGAYTYQEFGSDGSNKAAPLVRWRGIIRQSCLPAQCSKGNGILAGICNIH